MEHSDINSEPNPPKQGPLGIQVMESKDGKSRLRLEVQDWHLHSKEDPRVGGGVIMALSDSTAHFAIQSLLEDNELHATVDVKINFIRPGREGVLEAEGLILYKGSRFAVSEVSIKQDGKLVAKAQGTETFVWKREKK